MAFKATDGSHLSKPDLGELQDYSRETVRISTRKLSEETRFVVVKPSLFEPAYSKPGAKVVQFVQETLRRIINNNPARFIQEIYI